MRSLSCRGRGPDLERNRGVPEHAHPKTFLAKIFQRLVRAGLVVSVRGMNGGFRPAKTPAQISLLDIMAAIQGPYGVNVCAVNSKKCRRSSTCAAHPVWVDLRKETERRLREQTIDMLIKRS